MADKSLARGFGTLAVASLGSLLGFGVSSDTERTAIAVGTVDC